jgi:hypothetical protein
MEESAWVVDRKVKQELGSVFVRVFVRDGGVVRKLKISILRTCQLAVIQYNPVIQSVIQ